jgi:DNA repair protein RecO (recombination protein O)
MIFEKTQGITLQAIPYQERQRIITVFTQDKGLISLIIKGLSQKKPSLLSLSTPFCLADFVYLKGRSDIYFLKDATVLCEHLFLRKDLDFITSAYAMAKALLDSQLLHKPAPELFMLFLKYLEKIPSFPSQEVLVGSFLLKLLIHEGLINLKKTCNVCEKKASLLYNGESLCSSHQIEHVHNFSPKEFDVILNLAFIKNFSELELVESIPGLREKILKVFKELV